MVVRQFALRPFVGSAFAAGAVVANIGVISSSGMTQTSSGHCEHCSEAFAYQLYHSGFGDFSYAYCDRCGMTAILSYWSKPMPKMAPGCLPYQGICAELEEYLEPCPCGGAFKKGSHPRCPSGNRPLSAQVATSYIEKNAPGTKKGWRWQGNWRETYCMVVGDKEIQANFRSA
jgi:hypothetical protein